ncbi:hypothetical protein PHYBOEH_006240 [Phytophthora boehmeriae]|uniref:Uncharacterized protein n=1 Tax=Phytophthora boehmeriae TaxID=109152 RepID=A0A8T1XA52_9STRA|nr:hypothetical protein PHYBOEH_006240 [Phytophthora boehmeriae]
MNRLLQHFVADPNAAPSAPASRPPIPAPPQSSGGSYNAGNRGSYQRASPNGPFYYQPPPQAHYQQRSGPFGVPPQHSEGHGPNRSSGPLEEIPLSSQSTGEVYETVDLNADSSQQHRPHPQQQQRLFTPPNRPPQTPNSQGKSFNTPFTKRQQFISWKRLSDKVAPDEDSGYSFLSVQCVHFAFKAPDRRLFIPGMEFSSWNSSIPWKA